MSASPTDASLESRLAPFVAAWRQHTRGMPPPRWQDFLPPAGQDCSAEFVFALVEPDIKHRVAAGLPALLAEPYFEHPRLQEADAALSASGQMELIRLEYQLRWQRGERPPRAAYAERFPHHAAALQRLRPCWSCPHCRRPAIPLEEETAASATCPGCGEGYSVNALFPPPDRSPAAPADTPKPADSYATLPPAPRPPVRAWPAVPGYEILGELGRGGMGVVYKARQVSLKREVALKMILSGGHAAEADLRRLRAEAEAVARLRHPNVVQVYEVAEHDGLPFFSMEFCPGGGLDRRLKNSRPTVGEAVALVETLAGAVQAAHEAGVVHRDLKPANVLLAADGTPKVSDFGLAKKLDGTTGLTDPGAILGTPSYMPPEQAGGKVREVGPTADVYALGAILYECLTGQPPFLAETPLDTVLQVLTQEPVAPRRLNPAVAADLETVCLKCLHKEQARRYGSAAELAEELGRVRRGQPVQAHPPSLGYLLGKQVRRHRVALGAAAGVLLAAALGVVLAFVQINSALLREKGERAKADQLLGKVVAEKKETDRLLGEVKDREKRNRSLLARTYFAKSMDEYDRGNVRESLNWMLLALEMAKAAGPSFDIIAWAAAINRLCPGSPAEAEERMQAAVEEQRRRAKDQTRREMGLLG